VTIVDILVGFGGESREFTVAGSGRQEGDLLLYYCIIPMLRSRWQLVGSAGRDCKVITVQYESLR
jgi:hypothetical protein